MPTPAGTPRAITVLVRPTPRRLAGARSGARARAHLAANLLAASPGHVLPLVGRVVLRSLAGARVARGAAIVLTGLGDPVTLLLVPVVLGIVGIGGLGEADG